MPLPRDRGRSMTRPAKASTSSAIMVRVLRLIGQKSIYMVINVTKQIKKPIFIHYPKSLFQEPLFFPHKISSAVYYPLIDQRQKQQSTMPLVKIDMIKNVRTPDEIKKLADVVQEIMLEKFAAPPRDRYQVQTPFPTFSTILKRSL